MSLEQPIKIMLHKWGKLEKSLLVFEGLTLLAVLVPLAIAIATKRVSPYVPYISEAGGNFPEAGILNVFINIAAFACAFAMFVRFLIVEKKMKEGSKLKNWNSMSLVLGVMSMLFFVVLAAFPTTTITAVHNIAVASAYLFLVLYMFCQAWVSRKLRELRSAHRVVIVSMSIIALFTTATFGYLGSTVWIANHWVGKKIPGDRGFVYYVISASAEWILSFLFLAFFATMYADFKKYTFDFQVQSIIEQPTVKRTTVRKSTLFWSLLLTTLSFVAVVVTILFIFVI